MRLAVGPGRCAGCVRCSVRAHGPLCVMMRGTFRTHKWSAGSWTVAMPSVLQGVPTLGLGLDASGWMSWTAWEKNLRCGSASQEAEANATAGTRRMQECSAQVGAASGLFLSSWVSNAWLGGHGYLLISREDSLCR